MLESLVTNWQTEQLWENTEFVSFFILHNYFCDLNSQFLFRLSTTFELLGWQSRFLFSPAISDWSIMTNLHFPVAWTRSLTPLQAFWSLLRWSWSWHQAGNCVSVLLENSWHSITLWAEGPALSWAAAESPEHCASPAWSMVTQARLCVSLLAGPCPS